MGTNLKNRYLTTNQKGQSLIEVMVAAALVAVLGLGISTMVGNMNKGVVSNQKKTDFADLVDIIKKSAETQSYCVEMIGNGAGLLNNASISTSSGTTNLSSIRLPWNDQVIVPSLGGEQTSRFAGIYVTKVELRRLGKSISAGNYSAALHVEAERHDPSKPKARLGVLLSTDIPMILVDSDGNGYADGCSATANTQEAKAELIVAQVGPADCIGSDGAAIQSCLTMAASSNPARNVLIKSGTYTSVANLVVPANTTIRGEGGATILQSSVNSTTQGVFTISGFNYVTNQQIRIKDLVISQTQSSVTDTSAIYINNSPSVIIENVKFQNDGSAGAVYQRAITMNGNSALVDVTIKNNNFSQGVSSSGNFYGTPIYIAAGSSVWNLKIEDNRIQYERTSTTVGGGIVSDGTFYNTVIRNNTFTSSRVYSSSGSAYGIYVTAASAVSPDSIEIKGNRFDLALDGSVNSGAIVYNLAANQTLTRLFIADNIINGGAGMNYGMNFANVSIVDSEINRNIVVTPAGGSGIVLSTTTALDISENFIFGNWGTGTEVGLRLGGSSASRPKISNNSIAYFGNPIYVANTVANMNEAQISDNIIVNDGNGSCMYFAQSASRSLNIDGNSCWNQAGPNATAATYAIEFSRGVYNQLNVNNNIVYNYKGGIGSDNMASAHMNEASISNNSILVNANHNSHGITFPTTAAVKSNQAIGNRIVGDNTAGKVGILGANIANGNYVRNMPTGIGINYNTASFTASGNILENITDKGFDMNSSSPEAATVTGNAVHCNSTDTDAVGIMNGSHRAVISSNHIKGCKYGVYGGILGSLSISSNYIEGSTTLADSAGISGGAFLGISWPYSVVNSNVVVNYQNGIIIGDYSSATGNSIVSFDSTNNITPGTGGVVPHKTVCIGAESYSSVIGNYCSGYDYGIYTAATDYKADHNTLTSVETALNQYMNNITIAPQAFQDADPNAGAYFTYSGSSAATCAGTGAGTFYAPVTFPEKQVVVAGVFCSVRDNTAGLALASLRRMQEYDGASYTVAATGTSLDNSAIQGIFGNASTPAYYYPDYGNEHYYIRYFDSSCGGGAGRTLYGCSVNYGSY